LTLKTLVNSGFTLMRIFGDFFEKKFVKVLDRGITVCYTS